MPVFDTPITTNDQSLDKILAQKQPLVILLHNGTIDKPLEDALNKTAKKYVGNLLTVKINAAENGNAYRKFGSPGLPAVVTLVKNGRVKSTAEHARPADLRAHVDHLLNDTPLPELMPEAPSNGKVSQPVEVNDRNFKREVLQSKLPVLVDFWAPWCGPCRMIAPHIEQMAKDYHGQVKVVKLNTDENQSTAFQYQIRSIPTFMVFKDGQQVGRMSGADPGGIRRMVDQAIR